MPKRALVAALVAVLWIGVALPATAANTSPTAPRNECVVHVTGQKPSGELQLSAPRCYPTHTEAMNAEHVGAWGVDASARAALTASTFTLGYHCDGYNLVAPCTSVVGSDCTGGWLNVSASWNNKISSTQNGCPTIRHFDGTNLTGTMVPTIGVGSSNNLTTFNNRTTSIQYL